MFVGISFDPDDWQQDVAGDVSQQELSDCFGSAFLLQQDI
jgi:hypothetical protein